MNLVQEQEQFIGEEETEEGITSLDLQESFIYAKGNDSESDPFAGF